MASRYWIKLYHEILDDPKMGRLPDALFRRAIEFFLIAGENGRDGGLPALADMAWRLRADEIELLAQMEDLEALNILSRDAQGGWQVTHFAKRQAPSPAVERMRLSRESARVEHLRDKSTCCEDVAIRNIDTDIDIDKEKDLKVDADGSALQGQGADVPEPLRRPGARAKGKVGLEEETSDLDSEDVLVKLFVERTGLPLYLGGEEKWAKALARMQQAGVEEGDLEQAIDECRNKGLTIASLASVVTPAIIARAKRKAGRPEEDYRRYLKGEYGDFGR